MALKDGQERQYTVPLRKEWLKVPRWRRTKRSVAALQSFILKHTKAKEVKLSRWVNESLWQKGGKNPLGKITIKVKREKDIANVDLALLPPKAKRLAQKKVEEDKKKTTIAKKLKEKVQEKRIKKDEPIKKKSVKDLQKELEKVEEAKKKKQAKITKAQEIAMKK